MRTETFIKSFKADADVGKHRIVGHGAADNSVAQANGLTATMFGVSDSLGGKSGKVMDVVCAGFATVEYGGTVTRGAPLTSDSTGRAVVATQADSRIVGFATKAGVVGDLGTVNIAPGYFSGPGST